MKRKPRFTTLLILLLLVAGFGVLLYPVLSDYCMQWQQQKEIGQYDDAIRTQDADYAALWAAAEEYNQQLAKKGAQFLLDAEGSQQTASLLNPLGNGMMGYINISKIDLHLPIYQGTAEESLQAGVGHWSGSSLPTGGKSSHCVLTAHTGLVKAKMFTDLDQMEIGDNFTLSILNRELIYEVDQILIVEPEDTRALNIIDGEDLVTLYTCYPYGVNSHRLLVRGHRVDHITKIDAPPPVSPWEWMLLALTILLVSLALFFLIRRIFSLRKKKGASTKASR